MHNTITRAQSHLASRKRALQLLVDLAGPPYSQRHCLALPSFPRLVARPTTARPSSTTLHDLTSGCPFLPSTPTRAFAHLNARNFSQRLVNVTVPRPYQAKHLTRLTVAYARLENDARPSSTIDLSHSTVACPHPLLYSRSFHRPAAQRPRHYLGPSRQLCHPPSSYSNQSLTPPSLARRVCQGHGHGARPPAARATVGPSASASPPTTAKRCTGGRPKLRVKTIGRRW